MKPVFLVIFLWCVTQLMPIVFLQYLKLQNNLGYELLCYQTKKKSHWEKVYTKYSDKMLIKSISLYFCYQRITEFNLKGYKIMNIIILIFLSK